MTVLPVSTALMMTLFWCFLGTAGSVWVRYQRTGLKCFFLLSTLASGCLLLLSCLTLNQSPSTYSVNLGLSDYPLHFEWNALSAFFVLLLSASSTGIGLFASDYFRNLTSRTQSLLCFHYHWFLASMIWVFLAADAYSFLLAWELMALTSYFLVTAFKPSSETLHAGFLYLLMGHLGAIALLISIAIIGQSSIDFTFANLRQAQLSPMDATLAFSFALIGFSLKAGLIPLHVWLPKAHPVAPSPVSALMSGVMLKTAVYGLLRFTFDLLNTYQQTHWGLALMILGAVTAFLCVVLAGMQTDMKCLLAYSSMENMGIITIGIGLSLLLKASHQELWAALALLAALFHSFNHALMKSLLFLGTGSVLHATGQRNLGKLGGLILRMPWVAGFVLLGTLAIAGVPPLNGFISEWLLLQAFLFSPHLSIPYLTMLMPVIAALIALTIGLSAYVMVKFYGIIFLGKHRESQLERACDATLLERLSLGWFGISCLLFGIFPGILITPLMTLIATILNQSSILFNNQSSWLFVVPLSDNHASYSPLLVFIILCILCMIMYGMISRCYHQHTRRAPAWDCGSAAQTARMQDTAEGFGQPIKHMFVAFLHIKLTLPKPFDKTPQYRIKTTDRLWTFLYLPFLQLFLWGSKNVSKLQQGCISHYLIYSFATLFVLLWWAL